MRNFKVWFETFRHSINSYNYYTDFNKVYNNIDSMKIELNILNSLIGSKNIENEFLLILKKYPNVLRCIPILLAVRTSEIYAQDVNGSYNYDFINQNLSINQYVYFMKQTGLFDLISKHIINNLFDYVLGIEVGLDSNARKNRGGRQMEVLVEKYIKKTKVEYYHLMYLEDVETKWNIDLSYVSGNGVSTKEWDFVVKTKNKIYLIETNFYTSSGSKLNEIARSYKLIAEKIKV